MLQVRFRNIIIQEENHSDLLRKEIDLLLERLSRVFSYAELKMQKDPPNGFCYSFVKASPSIKMYICYFPEENDNPFIFFLNKGTASVGHKVSYKDLRPINNDYSEAFLIDAIRDISKPRFMRLQTDEFSFALKQAKLSL